MSTEPIAVEFKPKKASIKNFLPFLLMILVVLVDQVSKGLVVNNIPYGTAGIVIGTAEGFFEDFLRIIHVSNGGIAFSIGEGWSLMVRGLLFRLVPLVVLIIVLIVYFRNKDFTELQRWAIMGIVGGGFGNLIDRFFRAEGVVDFIDIRFYGLFGLERWPTFNIADSAVVICGILLILSFAFSVKNSKKGSDSKND